MKLSIITINYNNKSGLEQTMKSVLEQTYKDLEYIVVDGASTDGSVEVMNDYAQKIAATGVKVDAKSEKDSGLYNAMNKGVRKAKGEYVLMLNSGDYLVDECVIANIMPELDGTDIVQGNTIRDFSSGVYRFRGYGRSNISFVDAVEGNFLHQASFIKRNLHSEYGLYDESYKKAADTYFFITCLALGNATFKYVDIDIANYDTNGISSKIDPKWIKIEQEEDEKWFGEHIPYRMMAMVHETPKYLFVYESLHSNNIIWSITQFLIKISHWLKPPKMYVKKELLK